MTSHDKADSKTISNVTGTKPKIADMFRRNVEMAHERDHLAEQNRGLMQERNGLSEENRGLREERAGLNEESRGFRDEKQRLLNEKDALVDERDTVVRQNRTLTAERDVLSGEKVQLTGEKDTLTRQNDELLVERERLLTERQALFSERETLTRERDDLVQRRALLARENLSLTQEKANLVTLNRGLAAQRSGLFRQNQGLVEQRDGLSAQNEELLSRQKDLRGIFASALAHEIRSPLGVVKASAQLMMNPMTDEDRKRAVTRILAEVGDLEVMLSNLLDVAGFDPGQVELKKASVNIADVLQDVVEGYMDRAIAHGQRLSIQIDQSLTAQADAAMVGQALSNVLENAVKYTTPGGHIQINALRDGGSILVTIADSGQGIEPDDIPHVFDLSFPAGRQAESHDGPRLGLAVAKTLIEAHGGTIALKSDGRGKGATVEIRLPADEAAATSLEGCPAVTGDLNGFRFVVADDDEVLLEVTTELLTSLGCEVHPAAGGVQALAAIKQFHPDVALIDIGMPDMNGYDLARQVALDQSLSDVFLVALTGYGQAADKERTIRNGFSLHLTKPVDIEMLTRELAKVKLKQS